jgi:hypothetical protein
MRLTGLSRHVRRLLPNEPEELHMLLLFAFWAFDKKHPKFISRAKPEAEQFNSSAAASGHNKDTDTSQQKKFRVVNDTESLAKAVSSLAPS